MTILYMDLEILKKKDNKMTKKRKYSLCECTDILAIALSPHRETCDFSVRSNPSISFVILTVSVMIVLSFLGRL